MKLGTNKTKNYQIKYIPTLLGSILCCEKISSQVN